MKKKLTTHLTLILFLLGIGIGFGQTTFYTESFETNGVGYTFTANSGMDGQDFFERTNLVGAPAQEIFTYNNFDGSFFIAGEDIDGIAGGTGSVIGEVLISNIDISNQTALEFIAAFASGTDIDIDALNDAMWVEVNIDSGGWVEIGRFEADIPSGTNSQFAQDTNGDNIGDGILLNGTFTDFTFPIAGTGISMDVRISMSLNSGDEEAAFDNVRIAGISSSTDTTISLVSTTSTIAENGGSIDVCVNITNEDALIATTVELALDIASTTTNGTDYTTITYPVTLTFPAGSSANQCVTFTITDDAVVETDETIILNLQNVSGGNNATLGGITQHTLTITDNDSYNNCFTDNDDFEKVAVATNIENDVWTFSGGTYRMSGFCGFSCSEESNQWLILGDLDLSTYTGTEVLQLVLDAVEQFDGTTLSVNITDSYTGCPDDAGNSWVQLGTITSTGNAQTFDMSVASGSSSVYIGIQYFDNDGTYSSWNLSNIIIETDNPVCFTKNTPVISNCALTPTVSFDTTTSAVIEGNTGTTTHNIAVSISANPTADVVVDIITNEITATEDTDYTGTLVSLTFTPGGSLTQNISVPIIGDIDVEADETFTVDLSLSSGLANIGTNSHTVTITDDDVLMVTPCSELFFSKYVEGSSINKYLEIYNPTNSDVDLSDYSIVKYTNGSTTASSPFNLSGTLASQDVLIIERDIETLGVNADISTNNAITIFNGDDVIALQKLGTNIDIIGKIGEDPGSAWTNNGVSTKDMTLIRKVTIQQGDNDGSDAFLPDVEWIALPQNQVDYFGFHDSQCSGTSCTSTTVWNGLSWSNGDPSLTSIAIFDGDFNIDTTNINACEVYVSSTATLTVKSTHFLNIEEDITNKGLFLVENQASVVQVNNNATVTGDVLGFDVEITTPILQDSDRFTYFSSPTNAGDISNFSSFALANWEHNDAIQDWSYLGNGSATGAMTLGKGYAVRAGSGVTETVNFAGAFNNGVITRPLAFDVYNNIVDDYINPGANDDDSNFVGNPYPSAISADNLIMNNDISGVYIWTHESALAAVPTDQIPYADNDYIECVIGTCTNLNNTGNTPSAYLGFIASGQGFFVVATAATDLTFNNAMRETGNNTNFKSTASNSKLWLNMTTAQGYGKQIALTFTENGTANYDVKYESKVFSKNFGLSFYSFNALKDKLTINDTGLLTNDRTIPLGFKINSPVIDGATISIGHSENLEETNVYLIDRLLNVTHNLKESAYQIPIIATGEVNDRFEIVFNRSPLSTNDAIITNDTLVVTNKTTTQISVRMLDGSVITNFKAYDILGKLVIDTKPNKNSFVITTTIKQGQVLFIRATLENGQVLTNKFMKL